MAIAWAMAASGIIISEKPTASAVTLPSGCSDASRVFTRKFNCTNATPNTRGPINRATSRTSGSLAPNVGVYFSSGSFSSAGNWIKPCISAPPTTPSASPYTPSEGASSSTPRILPMEYIIGARAGHKKLR